MNATIAGRLAALLIAATTVFTGTAQAAAPPPPATGKNYHVTTHTGNRTNAGTDGNVYLQLFGTLRNSPEVQLDNLEDNFERNKTDQFDYRFADLGTLTRACVRFDHSNASDWYFDWVEVNGEFFQYYRWFEQSETVCRAA
jgi:hypothetical protein